MRLSKAARDFLWMAFGPDGKVNVDMSAVAVVVELREWLKTQRALDPVGPEPAVQKSVRRTNGKGARPAA